MQNVAWILFCSVLGIGCGCGALAWVCRMFRTRGREERLSRTEQILLLVGAAVCGGVIGSFANGWLPMVATMAVLTVGMAAAVSDWVCRIIPNPTVLAVFALKLLLMVGAMLKLAGAPSFSVLSALGEEPGEDEFAVMDRLHTLTGVPIPAGLQGLKEKAVRHTTVIDKEAMADFVMKKVKSWNE